MGILQRLFGREQRAQLVSADDRIMSILRSIEISPETAEEIPAVSACVDFIGFCIASLPVRLYRENKSENTTEEVKDDARLALLNDDTGDLLDPFQMKKAVISDYFLYGQGFIYPEMDGNSFLSLRYIKHGYISAYMSDDPIFKAGEYWISNGMRLAEDCVIKLLRNTKDGMTGESIVLSHQQLLTAMYREIVYEKMLVSTGGNKKGFLTSENKLTPEMLSDLRQKWNEMYANTGNTMMILNKGITFHESSNTSVEMQLNENKQRNNELACQMFGLSSDAISGQLGEDALCAAVKAAVVPVITAFENALDRGLLLPSERDLMYFAFDTNELLKGDVLKRYQAYKTGLECNVLQIDEARYKEDLPPLGLNWIKLGLQDVLYDPKTKVIYTPNMNQSMQMSENPVSFGGSKEEERAQQADIICVWGAPCSGKTTYVRENAAESDLVWDWDRIAEAVSADGTGRSGADVIKLLLGMRKAFLENMSGRVWFICTRPDENIRKLLGDGARYIRLNTSEEECIRRLGMSGRKNKEELRRAIERFFRELDNSAGDGIIEERDWITKNGRHIYIGEEGGTGASAKGENIFVKGFRNKQALNNHWQNGRTHQKEYADDGITTKEQYEERALELAESACSDTILGYKNAQNEIVRYDTEKNDFVKGNPNKCIKTMFKPKDGRLYFEEKRKQEAVEDE